MGATLEDKATQTPPAEPRRPAEDEVPALAPEQPRRSRAETARLAAEAVRRVQGQRGWRARVRAWAAWLLGR
ncbi:MAG: hypothetical protein ACOC8D_01595 [bacterium]